MIKRWHETVGPNDVVLHLGDLVFTTNAAKQEHFFTKVAPALPGRKYLILGNHDHYTKGWRAAYKAAGFQVIAPFSITYRGFDVEFHHYPTERDPIRSGDKRIRVHGHLHNNGYGHSGQARIASRYGHINVSVEEHDYRPVPIVGLLDRAIKKINAKPAYRNINRIGAKVHAT